jgi:DNA-binding MarR family transcriptional regulator
MDKEIRELLECTCLRLRRTTRNVTQLYDRLLQPAGLTANQLGLLARLYAASFGESDGMSIGTMAESIGMDPTTLNRNLKPLEAMDWVKVVPDSTDARVRIVRMTEHGRRTLLKAIPFWRQAQARLRKSLGLQAVTDLNELLDRSAADLTH